MSFSDREDNSAVGKRFRFKRLILSDAEVDAALEVEGAAGYELVHVGPRDRTGCCVYLFMKEEGRDDDGISWLHMERKEKDYGDGT